MNRSEFVELHDYFLDKLNYYGFIGFGFYFEIAWKPRKGYFKIIRNLFPDIFSGFVTKFVENNVEEKYFCITNKEDIDNLLKYLELDFGPAFVL